MANETHETDSSSHHESSTIPAVVHAADESTSQLCIADHTAEHGPPTILIVIILMMVVGIVVKRWGPKTIPYTIIISTVGAGIGLLSQLVGGGLYVHVVCGVFNMDPHLIFYIFLPILIFESSFYADRHIFSRVFWPCMGLAFPGLIVATGLTASMVSLPFLYPDWGWPAALLFGAIVSATDPVAVVGLLKELGAKKMLATLIDGESLLNDGAAIVLFTLFFDGLKEGVESLTPLGMIWDILRLVCVSPIIAVVLSNIAIFTLEHIFSMPELELSLTMALPYALFYISEAWAHSSGVLAVVTAGVYLNRHRHVVSPDVEETMHSVWEFASFVANTLIFFMLGVILVSVPFHGPTLTFLDPLKGLFIYVGVNIIRFVVIFAALPLLNRSRYCKISKVEAVLVAFAGLRGAVGIVLALTIVGDTHLDEERYGHYKVQLLLQVAVIVVGTLFLNGLLTKPLVKYLDLAECSELSLIRTHEARTEIKAAMDRQKKVLQMDRFFTHCDWTFIEEYAWNNPDFEGTKPEVQLQTVRVATEEYFKTFKQCVHDLHRDEVITARIVDMLIDFADQLLDELKETLEEITRQLREPRTPGPHLGGRARAISSGVFKKFSRSAANSQSSVNQPSTDSNQNGTGTHVDSQSETGRNTTQGGGDGLQAVSSQHSLEHSDSSTNPQDTHIDTKEPSSYKHISSMVETIMEEANIHNKEDTLLGIEERNLAEVKVTETLFKKVLKRLPWWIRMLKRMGALKVPGIGLWLKHRIAHIIKTQFTFAMGYYHAQDHTIQRLRNVHAEEQSEEVKELLKFMTKFARKSQVAVLKEIKDFQAGQGEHNDNKAKVMQEIVIGSKSKLAGKKVLAVGRQAIQTLKYEGRLDASEAELLEHDILGRKQRLQSATYKLLPLTNADKFQRSIFHRILEDHNISRQELGVQCTEIEHDGVSLLEKGDTAECVSLILDGIVKREEEDAFEFLGPMEVFGSYSVLTGQPSNASFRTTSRCVIAVIDGTKLKMCMSMNPQFAGEIWLFCGKRFVSRLIAEHASFKQWTALDRLNLVLTGELLPISEDIQVLCLLQRQFVYILLDGTVATVDNLGEEQTINQTRIITFDKVKVYSNAVIFKLPYPVNHALSPADIQRAMARQLHQNADDESDDEGIETQAAAAHAATAQLYAGALDTKASFSWRALSSPTYTPCTLNSTSLWNIGESADSGGEDTEGLIRAVPTSPTTLNTVTTKDKAINSPFGFELQVMEAGQQ